MMKTVGVIPARWNSSRFPGKSLTPILGKPLVVWVVEACRSAERLDEVIVATDDERIALATVGTGARTVMTRPDHPSGTDRVAEAAAPGDGDLVLNIQGDEPLIDPSLIDRLVGVLRQDPAVDMVTACTPIRTLEDLDAPSVVKIVRDARGRALYFSRLPIPFRRDGSPDLSEGLYQRHIGIYGFRGAFLKRFVAEPPCALERCEALEQLRALHLGASLAVVETDEAAIGVDRPEDVALIEGLLRNREDA